jgi:hypothetical protein
MAGGILELIAKDIYLQNNTYDISVKIKYKPATHNVDESIIVLQKWIKNIYPKIKEMRTTKFTNTFIIKI